ncbi:putative uncharacterized protein DDB_G0282133 isoform X2 [Condylostylus longicornis]|uniref:putative uncharacterized protein DDB_G0282133 isoform X2 n=1 Tax=Condylostylus longicornis TaxID=2530218 RepID=UPI00244E1E29|nr:putative uncharacterized protein DDB_G0282133 isoform X2 [Condylostylus longicornis]
MSFESNTSSGGVDPRVQIELEKLNTATDDINRLEVQIEEAKCDFKKLLATSVEKIKQSAHKLGNAIEAARPYYEARLYVTQLSKETQLAQLNYEKAKSVHAAAKEMVNLAELGVGESSTLDAACQEMLSHATSRVHESQLEVSDARNFLKICELKQEVSNNRVTKLQAQLKGAIKASRPYYETRANYNGLLKAQKEKIDLLENQVGEAKMTYNEALKNLERISEEIHKQRQERLNLNNLANNFGDNHRIDCRMAANISLQPLHSGLNRITLDDDEDDDISANSIDDSYRISSSNQRNNLYYTNQIDCCDEYLDLPSKITYKSSPIKTKNFDEHDCPHLLQDFPHQRQQQHLYQNEQNQHESHQIVQSTSVFCCNSESNIITNNTNNYTNLNNINRLSYYTNNSDDDKIKEASSSGISNDVDDIEQWTEIRLSNSNSSSSGYSHHESSTNFDEQNLMGLSGCGGIGMIGGGGGSGGSDTSESEEHRKVTCTTIVFNDDNNLDGIIGDKSFSKKKGENNNGGITSWISRSNSFKSSGRRQSLDLLIDASDKVASVFQKVGKSLERRNSESEVNNEQNDFFSFTRSDKELLSDEQVENLNLNARENEILYGNELMNASKNRLKSDISK